jgi:hypothetical protein
MRINELIVENQQIDELSLAGIGKGIGKAANVAGKAVGGAVGGSVAAAKQFGSGVKQGFQSASDTVSGTAPTGNTAAPAAQPTGTAPTAIQQTQVPARQPVTVRQITQAIPTLRKRDLTSVKNTVDATIAKKMPAPAENPNIVQGTNENFKSNFLGLMI